jgi:hypothetical protein
MRPQGRGWDNSPLDEARPQKRKVFLEAQSSNVAQGYVH